MRMGIEVGADAYITKPFEPQVLLAKIKELLEGQV
jgi:DNA-binding response OmpR family regulator